MKDTACRAIDLGATSGRVILAKMKHGGLEIEILNRFPNVIKEIDGRCYQSNDKPLPGEYVGNIVRERPRYMGRDMHGATKRTNRRAEHRQNRRPMCRLR